MRNLSKINRKIQKLTEKLTENIRISITVMYRVVEFTPERNVAKVILSVRHIGA